MRIATSGRLIWSDEKNQYIFVETSGYDYSGPVDLLKGGASKQEQTAADTQRTDENQLAAQQLALQQGQINSVNAAIDPIINSITQGQTPAVLQPLQSALTASYMNQLPNTYRNAAGALNQSLVARGLSGGQTGAGGGAIGQGLGYMTALLGQQQQQGATNAAQIMNQQQLGLLQNDLGLKLGVGNMYGSNFGGANQAAIGSLNAGVQAANNVDQAQTSWMGPVLGGLTGLAGKVTYGQGGGGFGFGCWIAKECYGDWNDPRVVFVRDRLWTRANTEFKFRAIMSAYVLAGEAIAKLVRRSRTVRAFFTRVFDKFIISERDRVLNELVNSFEL